MLQRLKVWAFNMLQRLKVWAFRKYYHFISNKGWKSHSVKPDYVPLQIPGTHGPLHARMYTTGDSAENPLIIYFHGGGWVIGDLDTHQPFCQALSNRSRSTLISIDYRLAPEHPFPAAHDDCLDATRWIAAHVGDFGPSNGRLVLAGDSAGGNLAACTCLELEPAIREAVAGAIVKYPVVDHYRASPPSYVERGSGQALTSNIMHWFWDTYLADCRADDPTALRAMPLHSDRLASLPPTFLLTAEFDPLRDEGIAFGDKLRDAGVAVTYKHFPDAAHGFACSEGPTADFEIYINDLVAWLEQFND